MKQRRSAMMVLVAVIFSSSANYLATEALPVAAQETSSVTIEVVADAKPDSFLEASPCWIRSWSPVPPQSGIGYPGPDEGFKLTKGVRSLAEWPTETKKSWVELTGLSNVDRFQQLKKGEIRIHEYTYSCPWFALPLAAGLATRASKLTGLYDPYGPTEGWLHIVSPSLDRPVPPDHGNNFFACKVSGHERVEPGSRVSPAYMHELWRVVLPDGLVGYGRYPGHVVRFWPFPGDLAVVTSVENCDAHGVASVVFDDVLRGLRPALDPQDVVVTNRLSLPFLTRERVRDTPPPVGSAP